MPRYITPPPPKSPELIEAEEAAAYALSAYFSRGFGVQAKLSRDTGIEPSTLSKMGKGTGPISLEQAILIDVATDGELRAEFLCPSRADLLARFVLHRAATVAKAA